MQVITSRKKICTQQFWTEALIKLDTPNISFSEFHSSHKRSWKVNTERNAPRADNSTSCLHIKKNNNNQTWYNYIDSSQSKHLLIVCCNRDQTSDIHGTLQLFTASWQNIEACMLVPITMYRSIIHAPGLSQSISLDSLLVTHLGYVQRNHVLIDIFTHWCGWRLIFRQEKDWVFFVLVYSSCLHPPTHHN